MKRTKHRIKENTKSIAFENMIFFDTETYEDWLSDDAKANRLRLGVGIYVQKRKDTGKQRKEVFDFRTIDGFWNKVLSYCTKHRPLYIIAHNIKFDIQVLGRFERLRNEGFVCEKYIEDQGKVIIKFARPNGIKIQYKKGKDGKRKPHPAPQFERIIFLDNMNLFNTSLGKLGESIGYGKGNVDFNMVDDDTLLDYCRNDVEIMVKAWEILRDFILKNDLGHQKMTIASTAFTAYRHRFMTYPIYIHDNEFANDLEREAYRGARTEPFKIGEFKGEPFYKLDVNSMYPYVMRNFNYPYNLVSCIRHPRMGDLFEIMQNYQVVAKVKLKTDSSIYGVRYKGKLTFPVGEFITTLTHPELERAIKEGQVMDVLSLSYYEAAPLFRDYVDFFYNARKQYKSEGNYAFSYLCKVLLNSLYGKFGQRVREWEKVGECDSDIWETQEIINAQTGERYTVRYHDGIVEESRGLEEYAESFPAIAAFVTAYARLILYDYYVKAGWENVFYSDTDSLIVNQRGYDNLKDYLDDSKLGYLKLEDKSDYLLVLNSKHYIMGDEVKLKGVKKDAKKVGKRTYEQWTQVGKNTKEFNEHIHENVWIKQQKELSGEYDKGIVLPDGQVKPLIMFCDDNENGLDVPAMEMIYGGDAKYGGKPIQPEYELKDVSRINKDKVKRATKSQNAKDNQAGITTLVQG